MDKWLKFNELIYKIPNLLVRGVEDMRSVLVNEYSLILLTVAISARMASAIYYKHSLTSLMGTICYYGTIQSGTDHQQIIFECRIQNAKCKIKNLSFASNTSNTSNAPNAPNLISVCVIAQPEYPTSHDTSLPFFGRCSNLCRWGYSSTVHRSVACVYSRWQ